MDKPCTCRSLPINLSEEKRKNSRGFYFPQSPRSERFAGS